MKLSIIVPAHNEAGNITACLDAIRATLDSENNIPYEIVCVDDNSRDNTPELVLAQAAIDPRVRLIRRTPPAGFGRAIRAGLEHCTGEVIVIFMADLSDDPKDVVSYYRKILEGYDCVFGSRFIKGSNTESYPWVKLIVNRLVNTGIRLMFWTRFNDLTNAFKAYRRCVVEDCGPYRASHFNITLELSLSALIRNYEIAQIPISWHGRKWGRSNLRLRVMGRKYLCTLLMMLFQRMLVQDDVVAEKLALRVRRDQLAHDFDERLKQVEQAVFSLPRQDRLEPTEAPDQVRV
jgi:dolichol-phosphate mannosyltransferase